MHVCVWIVLARLHRPGLTVVPTPTPHIQTNVFIVNIVCRGPMVQETGLLPSVVASAFVQRDACPQLLQEREAPRGAPSRGAT